MKSLKGTKTAENLMKSFAGDLRHATDTHIMLCSDKEGFKQIKNIFIETADKRRNMRNGSSSSCFGGLGDELPHPSKLQRIFRSPRLNSG